MILWPLLRRLGVKVYHLQELEELAAELLAEQQAPPKPVPTPITGSGDFMNNDRMIRGEK